MKELTIEEKYNAAIKQARKELKTCGNLDCDAARQIFRLFPELKESEDDKIRKELIQYLNDYPNLPNGHYCRDDFFTWLEKQGEKSNSVYDEKLSEILGIVMRRYINDPSIPYTEREKVSMEIIPYVERLEKQGEQKSADKIKPKFKVGDWITNSDYTWKIVEVKPLDYILQSQDGNIVDDTIIHVDEHFHLWTIKDAKNGDVLTTSCGSICIFNGTVEDGKYPFAYCGLTKHHGFEVYDRKLPFTHDKDIHPATKKEHDILFQKMKDAGY